MKTLAKLGGLCLPLIFGAALASAQQSPPRPPQAPLQEQSPDKTFEGSLSKLVLAEKVMTIKDAAGKEMMFTYDELTQWVGRDASPQGLGRNTAVELKVTYQETRGTNRASKIELIERVSRD